MKEIRNTDGKLVATVDEESGTVIILRHECVTTFRLKPGGIIEVNNSKA